MEILIWAFSGGIVGAARMDLTENHAAKIGINSGVNIALLGRWCLSLLHGGADRKVQMCCLPACFRTSPTAWVQAQQSPPDCTFGSLIQQCDY